MYEDTMGSAALCDEEAQSAQLERLLEFYSPDEIPPEPSNVLRRIPYNVTTGGSYFRQQLLDNRSETALAPSAVPIGPISPPLPPPCTEVDIEDLIDFNLLN